MGDFDGGSALAGAGAGAAIGSVVPGVGTVIGAGIGGLAGGFLGGGGGGNGGYTPQNVQLENGADSGRAYTAYNQVQSGLEQQQAFLDALKAQNGIQNQTDVYNRLTGVANGTGPNPAQAMLSQQTGNNIQTQAAMMAGQRGAGQNSGLIARQAAQQGGAMQQQAVGQGATMQAQQALGALNMQGGLATQMVGQQAAGTGAYTNATLNNQQSILNAIAAQNNAKVALAANMNNANAQLAGQRLAGSQNMMGNMMGAAGTVLGMAGKTPAAAPSGAPGEGGGSYEDAMAAAHNSPGMAHGGQVPHMADGGLMMSIPTLESALQQTEQANSPMSNVGRFYQSAATTPLIQADTSYKAPQAGGGQDAMKQGMQMAQMAAMFLSKGGNVPVVGEQLAAQGATVPGQAKVQGDSLKNDVVDAKLSPGEIVIPRSIAQGPNAPEQAAKFVAAILAKKGKLPKKA